MLRIDVNSSRELQAVLLAVRGASAEIRKQIRQQTKAVALQAWQEAVNANVSTRLESRVLGQTARVSVSDQNVRLSSATLGRSLSGGLKPPDNFGPVEFGGSSGKVTTYSRRSRNGGTHSVTRHTLAGFRPRNSRGYVFTPALREMVPRIASLWVQTVVRTMAEAFEGKRS